MVLAAVDLRKKLDRLLIADRGGSGLSVLLIDSCDVGKADQDVGVGLSE